MVAVEDLARLRDVCAVARALAPRNLQTDIEIVADDGRLGAAVGLLGETVHLAQEFFADLVVNAQCMDAVRILLNLLVAVLAELMLQHLHLLAQHHVALDAPHALAHLLLHLHLQREHVRLVGEDLVDLHQAADGMQLLENPLAILMAQGDVLRNEIGQMAGVALVEHGGHQIRGDAAHKLLIPAEERICLAQERFDAGAVGGGVPLLEQLNVRL